MKLHAIRGAVCYVIVLFLLISSFMFTPQVYADTVGSIAPGNIGNFQFYSTAENGKVNSGQSTNLDVQIGFNATGGDYKNIEIRLYVNKEFHDYVDRNQLSKFSGSFDGQPVTLSLEGFTTPGSFSGTPYISLKINQVITDVAKIKTLRLPIIFKNGITPNNTSPTLRGQIWYKGDGNDYLLQQNVPNINYTFTVNSALDWKESISSNPSSMINLPENNHMYYNGNLGFTFNLQHTTPTPNTKINYAQGFNIENKLTIGNYLNINESDIMVQYYNGSSWVLLSQSALYDGNLSITKNGDVATVKFSLSEKSTGEALYKRNSDLANFTYRIIIPSIDYDSAAARTSTAITCDSNTKTYPLDPSKANGKGAVTQMASLSRTINFSVPKGNPNYEPELSDNTRLSKTLIEAGVATKPGMEYMRGDIVEFAIDSIVIPKKSPGDQVISVTGFSISDGEFDEDLIAQSMRIGQYTDGTPAAIKNPDKLRIYATVYDNGNESESVFEYTLQGEALITFASIYDDLKEVSNPAISLSDYDPVNIKKIELLWSGNVTSHFKIKDGSLANAPRFFFKVSESTGYRGKSMLNTAFTDFNYNEAKYEQEATATAQYGEIVAQVEKTYKNLTTDIRDNDGNQVNYPGDLLEYTIVLKNNSSTNRTLPNPVVRDVMSEYLDFQSITDGSVTIEQSTSTSVQLLKNNINTTLPATGWTTKEAFAPDQTKGMMEWAIKGTMQKGDTVTITYRVKLKDASDNIWNFVTPGAVGETPSAIKVPPVKNTVYVLYYHIWVDYELDAPLYVADPRPNVDFTTCIVDENGIPLNKSYEAGEKVYFRITLDNLDNIYEGGKGITDFNIIDKLPRGFTSTTDQAINSFKYVSTPGIASIPGITSELRGANSTNYVNFDFSGFSLATNEAITFMFEATAPTDSKYFMNSNGKYTEEFTNSIGVYLWDDEGHNLNQNVHAYRYVYIHGEALQKINDTENWDLQADTSYMLKNTQDLLVYLNYPIVTIQKSTPYYSAGYKAGDTIVYDVRITSYNQRKPYDFKYFVDKFPVGQFPSGANPVNILDVTTNVSGASINASDISVGTPYIVGTADSRYVKFTNNKDLTLDKDDYINIRYSVKVTNDYMNTVTDQAISTLTLANEAALFFADKASAGFTANVPQILEDDTTNWDRDANTKARLKGSVNINYIRDRIGPTVNKSLSKIPESTTEGSPIDWNLRVSNQYSGSSRATTNMVNPIVIDVLPSNLEFSGYSNAANGTPTPAAVSSVAIYNVTLGGVSHELIVMEINATVAPGSSFNIPLPTKVMMGNQQFGNVVNKGYVIPQEQDKFFNGNEGYGATYIDNMKTEFNNYTLPQELAALIQGKGVKSEARVAILGEVNAIGYKNVSSGGVSASGIYGATSISAKSDSKVTYQLVLENRSSTAAGFNYKEVTLIDKMPFVNDKYIVSNTNQRGTGLQPMYIASEPSVKILTPTKGGMIEKAIPTTAYSIEYLKPGIDPNSISNNDWDSTNVNNWTTTYHAVSQGLRVILKDVQLVPGERVIVEYDSKVTAPQTSNLPVGTKVNTAWNSFAYAMQAIDNSNINITRNIEPIEPNDVGVRNDRQGVISIYKVVQEEQADGTYQTRQARYSDNIQFKIEAPGETTQTKRVGDNGNILFEDLALKEYTITEIVPKGLQASPSSIKADLSTLPAPYTFKTQVINTKPYKDPGGPGVNPAVEYTLHFDVDGGTHVANITTEAGTTIQLTQVTTKEGFIFEGWYAEKELINKVESVFLDSDKTVYAKWQKDWLNKDDHFAYIIGYDDGTIKPYKNITREEATTIFFRLLIEEVRQDYLTRDNAFPDVAKTRWSNLAISTMANAEVILGMDTGKFEPGRFITRAEFAAITARFDSDTYEGPNLFPDIDGHWAAEYINRAASKGWILGRDDGTFDPNKNITRAEVATLINRVLERKVETEADMLDNMKRWPDNSNRDTYFYYDLQEASNTHDYVRKVEGSLPEKWTQLLPNPDWVAYEKTVLVTTLEDRQFNLLLPMLTH